MSHSEVLGRVERRRRYSVEEKLSIVAEASAPGANISAVARRHGLHVSQVFKWRRIADLGVIGIPGASELPSFLAVQVAEERATPLAASEAANTGLGRLPSRRPMGAMKIKIGGGRCIIVDADVDADALARVLCVLERR
jgi:transposase